MVHGEAFRFKMCKNSVKTRSPKRPLSVDYVVELSGSQAETMAEDFGNVDSISQSAEHTVIRKGL